MNGPRHYERSEELIHSAEDYYEAGEGNEALWCLNLAQVHATLAQAAATIAAAYGRISIPNDSAWSGVFGS
jgi:hypothetical protein